ncbi:MAG: hypothetical protein IJ516_00640 [Phascolarctobacterium sp.]|nr:hypothetical protein [Phascolarctobacterium sp.]
MDKRTKNEREYIKAMSALSTVSSLALMTVFDFILAYWGWDWLDNYFQTGDHTFRLICIVIAIITLFLTFFKMIYTLILDKDEDE